jgi:quercetin dioxygenase-like cupin family protein
MKEADQVSPSRFMVPITREHGGIHRIGVHVALTGHQLQMTVIYMPAYAEVDWHSHPQESFVMVLEGAYRIWVGDETFDLTPGLACWVPANTPHRAVVGPNALVELEIFAPPRSDWAAITPQFDFRQTT